KHRVAGDDEQARNPGKIGDQVLGQAVGERVLLGIVAQIDEGQRGITANTVAPGAIATDFNGGHVRDNAEINRMVASVTALGRAGVADDIGPMIASLLSDDNRWVNAQRIEVSGGMNI
ncbi:SDR family oxidoreductase, partial [Mesorhizobium sp. M2C.T.Ca.TU.002.02.1.1]|uniref:SDR family oxidoreductase n=1 Tax=Mesorhizobium sp. M2C.T.Ca.TU.002.02.1.1 TaxID=2496788 RepID=UPI001FDFA45A